MSEMGRMRSTYESPTEIHRSTSGRVYSSRHGIEQDRRDFMRENPNLYAYIAEREAAKALDNAGDTISGHHAAANIVWAHAARKRERYEARQRGSS